VLAEVADRPTDWQLVVAGLGFLACAFGTVLTPWVALASLGVLGFLGHFLHSSRPQRRVPLPRQREELATPEPASNMRLV
jgi:hypothetical protein